MGCSTCIWLLVALATLVNGFGSFFPNDNEVIFDYTALIKAGTVVLNEPHDSTFYLFAKLHIQSPQDDHLLAQLRNVTFKLFNGKTRRGYAETIKELPIPDDAADLMKPFKLIYDKTGQIKTILTDKTEKMFARNMQKALGSLLQIKKDGIEFSSEVPHGFVTDENTMYGKSVTVYNVLPRKDHIVVQKMHDMKTTKHMYHTMVTDIIPDLCDAHFEEPLSHDSHQVYLFKKEDENIIPYQITATGGFYLYPYLAKSNVHHIHTTVTLKWLSSGPPETTLSVSNELSESDLVYTPVDPNTNPEEVPDILSMNHNLEYKKVVSMTEDMLNEMNEYMHLNSLDPKTFDMRKSHLAIVLIKLLTPLKLTDLQNLYEEFRSKSTEQNIIRIDILNEVITLLGTESSITLISKIVQDKKVTNAKAIHMLRTMTDYVQFPTENLLKNTEHMLSWGTDMDNNVRRAAVLNFAILVQKTFMFQKELASLSRYSHFDDAEKLFLEKHPIYDKYVNEFGGKLKSLTDIGSQILYMQALYNTGVPTVIPHLLPTATGKVSAPHDVREMALHCLSKVVTGNHNKVVDIFWPIFTNWLEDTELRIVAYYIIMTSHPPISRLLNIHWEMEKEPNTELYSFHYSFLKAMSEKTDPCNVLFKTHVDQLLKLTRKPIHPAHSRFWHSNIFNKEYNFGSESNIVYIATHKSRMFLFQSIMQVSNIKINEITYYVKIGGLSGELNNLLEINLREPEKMINYDKWYNAIKNIPNIKNVQIQVALVRNLNILHSYHFDEHNMNEMYELFQEVMKEQFTTNEKFLKMHYQIATHVMMPTEIGIPAYMSFMWPRMFHTHTNTNKEFKNSMTTFHVDNRYHVTDFLRWGLYFFNPIINVQQGVARKRSLDLVVPIKGDFSIGGQQFKASLQMHPEQEKNVIGLRSYVTNYVYIDTFRDEVHLTKSCEKCTHWHQVSKGQFYRHNDTLVYNKGTLTGFASKVQVFDTETYGEPSNVLNHIFGHESGSTMHTYTNHLHDLYYSLLLPSPDTTGYLLTIYPTNEIPVTQMDLSIRLASKLQQKPNDFLPSYKFVPRLTYTLKDKKEKPIKTWDVSLNMELNSGHTALNTKLEITRMIPDRKDYKICIDSQKKWNKQGVSGHTHIGMGETIEGVCSNDSSIKIDMQGKMLPEQSSPYHQYEICDLYAHELGADPVSALCAGAHTSIRKYDYDVKMHQIPSEYKNMLNSYLFKIYKTYMPYHRYFTTQNPTGLENNHYKIEIEYLTNDRDVNLRIIDKDGTQEFLGLPAREISQMTWHPDNTHYSRLYMIVHNSGGIRTCFVKSEQVQHDVNEDATFETVNVPTEWMYVIGDAENDAKNGVYVKRLNPTSNILALKLVHHEHTLEFIPIDDEMFQVLVDGKEVSQISDNYNRDWFNYVLRRSAKTATPFIVVSNLKFKLHMVYAFKKLTVYMPMVDGIEFYGPCKYKK